MKTSIQEKTIRKAAREVEMMSFLNYRDYLSALYDFCQAELSRTALSQTASTKPPKFSYQILARELGFGETNVLWLFCKGRRKMTAASGEKLAKGLGLKRAASKYLVTLIKYNNATSPDVRESLFSELMLIKTQESQSEDHALIMQYFSEWYHPIIREMSFLPNFRAEPQWLKKNLFVSLRPKQIQESLDLLKNLGFLKEKNGELVRGSSEQIFPERSSKNIALIRYHQKICEVTRDSVASVPEKLRDLNTVTVALSDESAKKVVGLVHELCSKIMEIEECDTNPDRLYQYNLQSFALTKTSKNPKAQDKGEAK